jgi:ribosomal protein L32
MNETSKARMEHNICETCGASDGRAGNLYRQASGPNECKNCHETRMTGNYVFHIELQRTDEERFKTIGILFPAKACIACPFNDGLTAEATQGQNYGCLPTKQDMLSIFDSRGVAMSCHGCEKACFGLVERRPGADKAPVLLYDDWYHNGVGQDNVRRSSAGPLLQN